MKNRKIECLGDNILVKLPEVKETTEAGIIKSADMLEQEAAKNDEMILEVVGVGPSIHTLRPGDKILIRNTHIPIYTIDDVRYGGIKEYDVFGIVK